MSFDRYALLLKNWREERFYIERDQCTAELAPLVSRAFSLNPPAPPSVTQVVSYRLKNSLYLSITESCTLSCAFCPKTLGSYGVKGYDLRMDHLPNVPEIIQAVGDPRLYREVVFCGYGEPTLRLKVLLEVARWIKDHGGGVRINSDGLANLVHQKDVLPLMGASVDALSVSLNAQDEMTYERHCRPHLPGSYLAMLDFLRRAPAYVPDVTATAIQGLEGVDIGACEQLARQLGVKFRRRFLNEVGLAQGFPDGSRRTSQYLRAVAAQSLW